MEIAATRAGACFIDEGLPDVFAFQRDISAIIQVQVSQWYLSHDTVWVLFVVSLLQPCVSVLILLNMNLLCHKLLLFNNDRDKE